MRRARRSTKGGYSLSAEREYPPLHPPRERALIGSLNLEELRSLRNQVRCTWLRHEPLRLSLPLSTAPYYREARVTFAWRQTACEIAALLRSPHCGDWR